MARFFCCGGAHLDYTARCKAGFVAGASNPVTVASSIGGAAHNTALNLMRLGHQVSLVSVVGADAAGTRIRQSLQAAGLELEGILQQAGQRTAAYTAILDVEGDLIAGLADMEIYDLIAPEELLSAVESLSVQPASADFLFLDANLPAEVLAALIKIYRALDITLCAAAVSPAKVSRLEAFLPDLELLFCNIAEVAALCGLKEPEDDALRAAAAALSGQHGLKLLVTRGAKGLMLFDRGKLTEFPAGTVEVVDVNGAGDAFAGGTLHALSLGEDIHQAIAYGQAAAALTLEVGCSTRETLSPEALESRLRA